MQLFHGSETSAVYTEKLLYKISQYPPSWLLLQPWYVVTDFIQQVIGRFIVYLDHLLQIYGPSFCHIASVSESTTRWQVV